MSAPFFATKPKPSTASDTHQGSCRGPLEEAEFNEFHRRTERPFWSYLMRLSGHPQVADDISQESYFRLLSQTRLPVDFQAQRAYLFKIGSRLIIDGRRRSRFEEPWNDIDEPITQQRSEFGLDVWRGLRTLKPKERAMLWLAYVEQYSHEEIAEILGLRKASIKVLLGRARKRLSKALSSAFPRGEKP